MPPRRPALEKLLERLQIYLLSGRQIIQGNPHGYRMGLAENRHMDVFTEYEAMDLSS